MDETQFQSDDEQQRAQDLSVKPARPPLEIPGYDLQRFIGAGAYGQVWAGINHNTGRQVAVKFYIHSGGLDWSLLSREVEKLRFLSADRYVVQLLDVGWEADPPYYVMEYIENGSLDEYIKQNDNISVPEVVELFREIAIGMMHAHGKGVLHCDLKPSNVLLDADNKPRLADFGQSRLTNEQTPALGTLFYMAPEQADLKSVPDARWDVYALGSLLYCMLVGHPPHRTDKAVRTLSSAANLEDRLSQYRTLLRKSPLATEHRKVPGVDRALADIIDRCLVSDSEKRYANVQAVLADMDARETRRARRPLLVMGAVGPAVLLLLVNLFAFFWFNDMMAGTEKELTNKALHSNQFAAQLATKAVANELTRRFNAVEEIAQNLDFQRELGTFLTHETIAPKLKLFADPLANYTYHDPDFDPKDLNPEQKNKADEIEKARIEYEEKFEKKDKNNEVVIREADPAAPHGKFQKKIKKMIDKLNNFEKGEVASWVIYDTRGNLVARWPHNAVVSKNYSWRAYFNGEKEDQDPTWRKKQILGTTTLAPVFRSQATKRLIMTISTPIIKVHVNDAGEKKIDLLGVFSVTADVGQIETIQTNKSNSFFAVLVEKKSAKKETEKNLGLVLQHHLYSELQDKKTKVVSKQFVDDKKYRIELDNLPSESIDKENLNQYNLDYRDPFAKDPKEGEPYKGRWLAVSKPVVQKMKDMVRVVLIKQDKENGVWQVAKEKKEKAGKREESENWEVDDNQTIEDWHVKFKSAPLIKKVTSWVVIVQNKYDDAIGNTLQNATNRSLMFGMWMLIFFIVVITGLWGFVLWSLYRRKNKISLTSEQLSSTLLPSKTMATLAYRPKDDTNRPN